jgi:hypothetical protein
MRYLRAALALAGTVGLLVLFAVEPYKALLEERMGWRPSESPARALSEDLGDKSAFPSIDAKLADAIQTVSKGHIGKILATSSTEDRWRKVRSKSPSRASRTLPADQYEFVVEGVALVGPEPAKFMGAARVPNREMIVLAPLNSDSIGVLDGCPDCLHLFDISAQISGPQKFTGACAIEDDGEPLIIFAPGTADSVGIFNPNSESFRLVDISDKIDVDYKFWGCAVEPNGKIVFAPANGDAVGIFNPGNDEFELVDISAQIHSMFGMFVGAVAAPNGKIIFVPGHAHSVGVFDPDTYNFALVPLPPTINPIMEWKWAEGALAPNGKVVFAPCNADAVGVFDPVENTMELVDISAKINSAMKFWGAATTNGKIIFAPWNADAVGAFFPATNELPATFELLDISAQVDMDKKYAGAVAAPYPGAIETMFVPHNAGNIPWFVDFSNYDYDGGGPIPTTSTTTTTSFIQVKLRLKVKGKSHLKAWMKVKIVDGAVTASGKVKESHRRRRRRRN